jgi:hypothetical protein
VDVRVHTVDRIHRKFVGGDRQVDEILTSDVWDETRIVEDLESEVH